MQKQTMLKKRLHRSSDEAASILMLDDDKKLALAAGIQNEFEEEDKKDSEAFTAGHKKAGDALANMIVVWQDQ